MGYGLKAQEDFYEDRLVSSGSKWGRQAKESWEMNSEEKLEQSTIVKERGTVYFKVSQQPRY